MKIQANALVWLLGCATLGFAGGTGDLQDYDLTPAAARLLAEYERVQDEGFLMMETDGEPSSVLDDALQWHERSEELSADPPAYHYLRARIEYDAYHRVGGMGDAQSRGYLDRALEHIDRFVNESVAFADGHALHGAILGQKIAANPLNVALYAGAAKQANTTALGLDPDNQMAHLNLGFTFAYTPEAFGGDRKLAVKHFGTAFESGAVAMRAVAGVWLSVTYDQLGDSERATEVIEAVLQLAPGFPLAEATAHALADGADPLVYIQRLQNDEE